MDAADYPFRLIGFMNAEEAREYFDTHVYNRGYLAKVKLTLDEYCVHPSDIDRVVSVITGATPSIQIPSRTLQFHRRRADPSGH